MTRGFITLHEAQSHPQPGHKSQPLAHGQQSIVNLGVAAMPPPAPLQQPYVAPVQPNTSVQIVDLQKRRPLTAEKAAEALAKYFEVRITPKPGDDDRNGAKRKRYLEAAYHIHVPGVTKKEAASTVRRLNQETGPVAQKKDSLAEVEKLHVEHALKELQRLHDNDYYETTLVQLLECREDASKKGSKDPDKLRVRELEKGRRSERHGKEYRRVQVPSTSKRAHEVGAKLISLTAYFRHAPRSTVDPIALLQWQRNDQDAKMQKLYVQPQPHPQPGTQPVAGPPQHHGDHMKHGHGHVKVQPDLGRGLHQKPQLHRPRPHIRHDEALSPSISDASTVVSDSDDDSTNATLYEAHDHVRRPVHHGNKPTKPGHSLPKGPVVHNPSAEPGDRRPPPRDGRPVPGPNYGPRPPPGAGPTNPGHHDRNQTAAGGISPPPAPTQFFPTQPAGQMPSMNGAPPRPQPAVHPPPPAVHPPPPAVHQPPPAQPTMPAQPTAYMPPMSVASRSQPVANPPPPAQSSMPAQHMAYVPPMNGAPLRPRPVANPPPPAQPTMPTLPAGQMPLMDGAPSGPQPVTNPPPPAQPTMPAQPTAYMPPINGAQPRSQPAAHPPPPNTWPIREAYTAGAHTTRNGRSVQEPSDSHPHARRGRSRSRSHSRSESRSRLRSESSDCRERSKNRSRSRSRDQARAHRSNRPRRGDRRERSESRSRSRSRDRVRPHRSNRPRHRDRRERSESCSRSRSRSRDQTRSHHSDRPRHGDRRERSESRSRSRSRDRLRPHRPDRPRHHDRRERSRSTSLDRAGRSRTRIRDKGTVDGARYGERDRSRSRSLEERNRHGDHDYTRRPHSPPVHLSPKPCPRPSVRTVRHGDGDARPERFHAKWADEVERDQDRVGLHDNLPGQRRRGGAGIDELDEDDDERLYDYPGRDTGYWYDDASRGPGYRYYRPYRGGGAGERTTRMYDTRTADRREELGMRAEELRREKERLLRAEQERREREEKLQRLDRELQVVEEERLLQAERERRAREDGFMRRTRVLRVDVGRAEVPLRTYVDSDTHRFAPPLRRARRVAGMGLYDDVDEGFGSY